MRITMERVNLYLRVGHISHRSVPNENNDECTIANDTNNEYYAKHYRHQIRFWPIFVIFIRHIGYVDIHFIGVIVSTPVRIRWRR